jgi:hypothetical protein
MFNHVILKNDNHHSITDNLFLCPMERVKFIKHNWRQILLLDFSGCSVDEAIKTIAEASEIIRSQPESSVSILTDVTGARYNLEVVEKLKVFTSGNKPYVRASAVVGLDGLGKIVYNAVIMFSKRKISVFEDIEKAKDWLIEE